MGGESRRYIAYFLAAAIPVLASAQQPQDLRDRDPDLSGAKRLAADLQQANFHRGPFYLMSRFRISDAGFSGSAGVPAGGDDLGISLSVDAPQRLYFVPAKKVIFSVEAIPGYTFIETKGDDERSGQFDYLVRGDAHFLWNHLYLDVYAQGADQLRAHVADINRLATAREYEGGVTGEWKYSSRTSGVFTLRNRETTYPLDRHQPVLDPNPEFNPIELLDRSERNGRVSLMHKTFPLTSFFVSTEVSDYSFDNATYKDSRRTWISGGAIWDSGRTQVRVEAGPARLVYEDPGQRDFDGVIASVEAVRSNGRWTYHASADRDLGFSIFADNNHFVSDGALAGVSYTATRRLTLRANSAWQRDRYDVPVNGFLRRDTTSFNTVGFIYGLGALRIGSDVGWYERDSTYGGDTDSGIRYVVHLSFTP